MCKGENAEELIRNNQEQEGSGVRGERNLIENFRGNIRESRTSKPRLIGRSYPPIAPTPP